METTNQKFKYDSKNHGIVEFVRNQVGAINNLLIKAGCPMKFTLESTDFAKDNWEGFAPYFSTDFLSKTSDNGQDQDKH